MPSQDETLAAARAELLPGERLLSVTPVAPVPFPALPDVREELRRLTATPPGGEIGTVQPAVASLSRDGTADPSQRLFEVHFGRDSLKIARNAQFVAPALMRTTLRFLAERQGLARDRAPEPQHYDARREEPGRIVHEVRDPRTDAVARDLTVRWGWRWPYFNSDDAALLFARELVEEVRRNRSFLQERIVQRDGVSRSMAEALIAACEWAATRCANAQGLFESRRPPSLPGSDGELPAYPVWMDSADGALREDATLCTGPMAWIEVQAQAYDAFTGIAHLAALGLLPGVEASAWHARAALLQASVLRHFQTQDRAGRPLVAYATERIDGELRPLRVLRSNPAAALDSGLFVGLHMRRTVVTILEQTFNPARGLLCPSGVRSLGKHEVGFSPGRYHNGQVWLHDTHDIARGLARHGFLQLAVRADRLVTRSCRRLRHYPETIRGVDGWVPEENAAVVKVAAHDPSLGDFTNQILQPGQAFQGFVISAFADAQIRLGVEAGARSGSVLERQLVARVDHMMGMARRATSVHGGLA